MLLVIKQVLATQIKGTGVYCRDVTRLCPALERTALNNAFRCLGGPDRKSKLLPGLVPRHPLPSFLLGPCVPPPQFQSVIRAFAWRQAGQMLWRPFWWLRLPTVRWLQTSVPSFITFPLSSSPRSYHSRSSSFRDYAKIWIIGTNKKTNMCGIEEGENTRSVERGSSGLFESPL